MSLIPLYDKIVIKLKDKQEIKSKTGLVYTKNMSLSANSTMVGEVIAIGDGRLLADGQIVPLKVQIGDLVVFSKLQGENYNDGSDDYTILSEANVLMIVKEEEN